MNNLQSKRNALIAYYTDIIAIGQKSRGLVDISPVTQAIEIVNNMSDIAVQRIFKKEGLQCYYHPAKSLTIRV